MADPNLVPCRFGFACTRLDCKFHHPNGRRIDGSNAPPLYVNLAGPRLSLRPVLASEVVSLMHVLLPLVTEIESWKPMPIETVLWIELSSSGEANLALQRLVGQELLGRKVALDTLAPRPPTTRGDDPFSSTLDPSAPHFQAPASAPVTALPASISAPGLLDHRRVSAIGHLEKKWAAVFAALQHSDILHIVQLHYLPPCSTWKPLLRSLFEHGLVTMQNDEAEVRAIFQQIARVNLLSLERFPAADRSTTLKDIKARLRRLAGRTLILVDGDNFPNAPTIGLDLFPPPLPPNTDLGFLVVSFVSQAANFKAFQRAVDQPWFYFVHAQTNAKDAADHVLTGTAFVANEICDVTSPILVLSRDGFARETVETLKTLEPERDIRLISPQQFGGVLQKLGAEAGFHTKGVVPTASPGLQQRQGPRFSYEPGQDEPVKARSKTPPPSQPQPQPQPRAGPVSAPVTLSAPQLRAPGPASAASLLPRMAPQQVYQSVAAALGVSSEKLALPRDTAQPWAGYRCKLCGKDGGLPDSHWEELCPLSDAASVASTASVGSSAAVDRTRPWRDYVCPFCHKPGGLPDSHYHWACPHRPADGGGAPFAQPKYVIETPDGRAEAPPDAASVWRQEEERFSRFVAILNKLYVQRDILAVRLSTLGVVMRENFVYSEKAGLKPLVERAVELGLAERRGEQGNAELVLLKERIRVFASAPTVGAAPAI